MIEARLPREAFMALAAVGWADGTLDAEEADAIARTAAEDGLELEEIQAVEAATKSPVKLGDVDVSQLSDKERLYVYAIAVWIALISDGVSESERNSLDVLGYALRLTAKGRAAMDETVRELIARPEGIKPYRFDLSGLRAAIRQRVEAAASPRAKSE